MAVFVLNEKVLSRGGDMWIEDASGRHVYEVRGSFGTVKPHYLLDPQGNLVYEIALNLSGGIGRVFEIRQSSDLVARVKQATFSFLATNFTMTLATGEQIPIKGNYRKREFRATRDGEDMFVTSRKLVSFRESYGVEVSPHFETPLALAAVIAIEEMERDA